MTYPFKKEHLDNTTNSLLVASGCAPNEAKIISSILTWCDQIGRYNQGVWRLPLLTKRFASGLINSPCHAEFSQVKSAIGILNAHKGSGHYIAHQAMEVAIDLAHKNGVGAVGGHDSNFFGAGAYYINQASQAVMIGIALSNSVPKVAAYGGIKRVLGTNPFAFSAPRKNGQHLLLDMSTASSAGSSITKAAEQGHSIDSNIAIDAKGKPTTDPLQVGALLPFGGAKGFGLSLFVDILSGVLTGAGFSEGVKSMVNDHNQSGNNGHFFIALDIASFIDIEDYYQRIEDFLTSIKSSSSDPENPVLYPGQIRWDHYQKSQEQGISLDKNTVDKLSVLCEQYDVPFEYDKRCV